MYDARHDPTEKGGQDELRAQRSVNPGKHLTLDSYFLLLESRATVLGSSPMAGPSQTCHHLVSGLWLVRNLRRCEERSGILLWVLRDAMSFAQQRE